MTHYPTAKGIVNAWQKFAVANRVFLKDMPSCCSGLLHRLPTASSSVCCFGFSVSPFPCITVGEIRRTCPGFIQQLATASLGYCFDSQFLTVFLHPFTFFIGQVLQQCVSATYPQPGRVRVCTLHSFPTFLQCVDRFLQRVA